AVLGLARAWLILVRDGDTAGVVGWAWLGGSLLLALLGGVLVARSLLRGDPRRSGRARAHVARTAYALPFPAYVQAPPARLHPRARRHRPPGQPQRPLRRPPAPDRARPRGGDRQPRQRVPDHR